MSEQSRSKGLFGDAALFLRIKWCLELLLFVCALATLIVMYKQLGVMREQSINQTRAWVTVNEAESGGIEPGEKLQAHVALTNSGGSPALNLSHYGRIGVGPSNAPPSPENLNKLPKGNRSVLGPRARMLSTADGKIVLSQEDVQQINNGNMAIYVLGIVKYDDIFGIQRETLYCLRYRTGTHSFDTCEKGNRAN